MTTAELAPEPLTRVFYSDNGSTAAEVALKMAFQFHQHRGEGERTGFICLRNSYHGDTIGSVSVGGIELFHSLYRPLLFDAWQAEPGDAGRAGGPPPRLHGGHRARRVPARGPDGPSGHAGRPGARRDHPPARGRG